MMKIFVDGSGSGKYAFVYDDLSVIKEFRKDGITNNQAEYLAVIEVLRHAPEKSRITICSDSRLVVEQMKSNYHIKDEKLRALFGKAHKIIASKNIVVEFAWVPRKENKAGKFMG